MAEKKRLDLMVVERGFADSREKAKALIMSGKVYVNNQKEDKPGTFYKDDITLELKGPKMPYVSRGGYKLIKAIESFCINLNNKTCIDIGASTGGFTDCMLQNGALKVYSVDVGYGQLAWKLRIDQRVINLERTNIRYITDEQVPDKIDFFSIDVSFISLCLIFPVLYKLMKTDAKGVCLIKPQFEAGKDNVGKKGVVRDPKIHKSVINKIVDFVEKNGFNVLNIDFSPIKGPQGNIEYLLYIEKAEPKKEKPTFDIEKIVKDSHIKLNGGEYSEDIDNSES